MAVDKRSKKERKRDRRERKRLRLEAEALESTRLVIATAQLEMLRHLENQAETTGNPISVGYFRAMIRNIGDGRSPMEFEEAPENGDPAAS